MFDKSCYLKLRFVFTDDHSRVVLTGKRETPGSDYINANYVDVRLFFLLY